MNPICLAVTSPEPRTLYQAIRYCYARYSFCLAELRDAVNKLLRAEGMGEIRDASTPDELLTELEDRTRKRLEREAGDVSEAVIEDGVRNFLVSILSTALLVFADKVKLRCPEARQG